MTSFSRGPGPFSLSVFVKCLLIVAASTAIVAGVVAVSADRLSRQVAEDGLRQLALDVSAFEANALQGAVRFRKADDAQAILDRLLKDQSAQMLGGLALTLDGTVLAEIGDLTDADLEELRGLAQAAGDRAGPMVTGDGFWIAKPIVAGDQVIGSVALAWTPDATLARIASVRSQAYLLAGVVFLALTLASGFFFRQTMSLPLRRLAERTTGLADRDLDAPVPGTDRKDEIGLISSQLEVLRDRLKEADGAALDARFQSAGFQGASVPLVMIDSTFRITHANAAFRRLRTTSPDFAAHAPADLCERTTGVFFDPRDLAGTGLDTLPGVGDEPAVTDIEFGARTYKLVLSAIADEHDATSGYVMEWTDVTEARTTRAVLAALESSQVRMDFDRSGQLIAVNATLAKSAPDICDSVGRAAMDDVLGSTDSPADDRASDTPFRVYRVAGRLISGMVSPIQDDLGTTAGHVFLGHDVTESEVARQMAEDNRTRLEAGQRVVVEAVSDALNALADGDLSVRIEGPFPDEYEELRHHFNASVAEIETAVAVVRENSGAILGESENIAGAADDLSRRTEQQAATLEQFAASLTELTASVASTADGAGKASDVVTLARGNAETSGGVVREAVTAMGEIESSSDQISRIIGVIDDIAFQTNLLALNAGVEAARAGEAGRGFAVVASEVRALAQRSSDAAREINELISSSSQHVSRGVSLVGKAGVALADIVASVGDIAEHVTAIAASAREQSIGIDEINTAMSQLDEATQQNVAMFEETTAATHTLRAEATALATAADKFTVGPGALIPSDASFRSRREIPEDRIVEAAGPAAPPTRGALALAPDADDDDWEDF